MLHSSEVFLRPSTKISYGLTRTKKIIPGAGEDKIPLDTSSSSGKVLQLNIVTIMTKVYLHDVEVYALRYDRVLFGRSALKQLRFTIIKDP